MLGTDTGSGVALGGLSHLRQSIIDALRTPLGSRAMRPEYGSRLFFLLDRPCNDEMRAEVTTAVVESLINCVSQVMPKAVILRDVSGGRVVIDLTVTVSATGEDVSFENMEVSR